MDRHSLRAVAISGEHLTIVPPAACTAHEPQEVSRQAQADRRGPDRCGVLEDGRKVTADLFRAITREELRNLRNAVGAHVFENGNFERAAALIDEITTAPDFETFITLPAYRVIH